MGRKKNPDLDGSAEAIVARRAAREAEMEAKGCPFGRDNAGKPRLKPYVSPEMRSYYKIFGLGRTSNALEHITDAKSVKHANKLLLSFAPVIRNNYSAIEIVRCKRISYERVV